MSMWIRSRGAITSVSFIWPLSGLWVMLAVLAILFAKVS